MATTNRGGPRPKTRPDDARGGLRLATLTNPGRPVSTAKLRTGDVLDVTHLSAAGQAIIGPDGLLGDLWTVTEITRSTITLRARSGEVYRLRR